jgi:tRNA (guanine37-N1)-methyltransferase
VRIDILTLFPQMFQGPLTESILKRAQEKSLLEINIHNIRDFTKDKHRTVDDRPFGGGVGMVMKPEPIFEAVDYIKSRAPNLARPQAGPQPLVILLCPQGRTFTQDKARELANQRHLVFLCGHYEGVDERIREHLATDEISIGDYILTGGELACMAVIDALARMIPGVLEGGEISDSFYDSLLDYPHYTRPSEYRGMKVPEVLLSGNHQEISKWQKKESLRWTLLKRPDLLEKASLSREEKKILKEIKNGRGQES